MLRLGQGLVCSWLPQAKAQHVVCQIQKNIEGNRRCIDQSSHHHETIFYSQ